MYVECGKKSGSCLIISSVLLNWLDFHYKMLISLNRNEKSTIHKCKHLDKQVSVFYAYQFNTKIQFTTASDIFFLKHYRNQYSFNVSCKSILVSIAVILERKKMALSFMCKKRNIPIDDDRIWWGLITVSTTFFVTTAAYEKERKIGFIFYEI